MSRGHTSVPWQETSSQAGTALGKAATLGRRAGSGCVACRQAGREDGETDTSGMVLGFCVSTSG